MTRDLSPEAAAIRNKKFRVLNVGNRLLNKYHDDGEFDPINLGEPIEPRQIVDYKVKLAIDLYKDGNNPGDAAMSLGLVKNHNEIPEEFRPSLPSNKQALGPIDKNEVLRRKVEFKQG